MSSMAKNVHAYGTYFAVGAAAAGVSDNTIAGTDGNHVGVTTEPLVVSAGHLSRAFTLGVSFRIMSFTVQPKLSACPSAKQMSSKARC